MPDDPYPEPQTVIRPASNEDWPAAADILREYFDTLPEEIDRAELHTEAQRLPGDYAAPRGIFLLAWVDDLLAGCCGLRPLDESDHMGAAEMRRLYVRPAFRGLGLGRQLSRAGIAFAAREAYDCVLLDTLDTMEVARQLYQDLGFYEIEPYYYSPIKGAHYLKRDL